MSGAAPAPLRPQAQRGVFISFEGGDGAGKTTHIRFLAAALRGRGREVLCLREPGGTEIGEALRSIVLDPDNDRMSDRAELLVYEAARAQIVDEVIAPALERGAVVLCDRFTDSTVAYQAFGRGLAREFVDRANDFACHGTRPDRTILLCAGAPASDTLERATHRIPADRMERAGLGFHERVNRAFLLLAEEDPQRVRLVDSSAPKAATARAVFACLEDLFPWMADADACPPGFFDGICGASGGAVASLAAARGEG